MNNLMINTATPVKINHNSKNSFRSKTRQEKIAENKEYLKKQEYIRIKTLDLRDTMMLFLLVGLGLNAHNVDFSKKLKTSEKIGVGAIIASFLTIIPLCVKHIQLSKEYDKENKK